MVVAIVVAFFLIAILWDLWTNIEVKEKPAIWFHYVCLFISFVIILLKSFDISIPGPHLLITKILEVMALDN